MKILNRNLNCLEISRNLTVPDCNVCISNKVGTGNGEKKFYFGTKEELDSFFAGKKTVKCFFLRSDLESYMLDIKSEYIKPTQPYAAIDKFPTLWAERNDKVSKLDEVVWFTVTKQDQIAGPRGYINSDDEGYNIFRELALPNTSYIMIMKLSGMGPEPIFYWKFFVDFKAIHERKSLPLVYTYGKKVPANFIPLTTAGQRKKDNEQNELARVQSELKKLSRDQQKQKKYRDALFAEQPFCPITNLTEERLLIASHIKPFECCETEKEAYDPMNGFLLSPLYDKLFDKGFISFTDDRKLIVSNWLSPNNQKICGLKKDAFYQQLPINEKRIVYLNYHRAHVFKG